LELHSVITVRRVALAAIHCRVDCPNFNAPAKGSMYVRRTKGILLLGGTVTEGLSMRNFILFTGLEVHIYEESQHDLFRATHGIFDRAWANMFSEYSFPPPPPNFD
jgi:hypothetical protein